MDSITSAHDAVIADRLLHLDTWCDNGTKLLVASPREPMPLCTYAAAVEALAHDALPTFGGILLREFPDANPESFRRLAASMSGGLMKYDFASTPRMALQGGLYSSTEYPADQSIPQHNEQSYTTTWPMKIWFYCAVAAESGGETPLTDSRLVYQRIDPGIRARFMSRGLMYVRNYGNGLDLPWQDVFGTVDKTEVERFCRGRGMDCIWLAGNRLRTTQVCQATALHPATNEMVWFNQAHLFHVSSLHSEIRTVLLEIVDEMDLPRNVYYADGEPIEIAILDEVRAQYKDTTLQFSWHPGDVLLLDNMLMAHGRKPFEGPRSVLVAMAEPHPHPAGVRQRDA